MTTSAHMIPVFLDRVSLDGGHGGAPATDTPLEDRPTPPKLPVARRVALWFRRWRLWKILGAMRGPRLQFGTQADFDNERIADGIKTWARRAAYWLLVPAVSVGLY